jgi:hypothetical protein
MVKSVTVSIQTIRYVGYFILLVVSSVLSPVSYYLLDSEYPENLLPFFIASLLGLIVLAVAELLDRWVSTPVDPK